MAIDLEQIKKNYAGFDDFKIEHLAKNEAGSFEPEVLAILMDEIKKRGLDSNLNKGIEAQTQELTEADLIELKSKIKSLACPECGQKISPLTGTLIREVKSFIVFTYYTKTPYISCPVCANGKRKKALITTALLGWWGIPWGLFRTPYAMISSLMDNKKREIQSDLIMTDFVVANRGEIRTNWDNDSKLVDFIQHTNKNK
jgi:hypothetical protein